MSAEALIREAHASGIELRLVDGKVKAIGPREAVARLLLPLREQRAELAEALQVEPVERPHSSKSNKPFDPADWRALAAAYLVHHLSCPACIVAGRGHRYGLRCGAGAALWRAYSG